LSEKLEFGKAEIAGGHFWYPHVREGGGSSPEILTPSVAEMEITGIEGVMRVVNNQ
jgi:hypothetical protein